MGYLYIILKQNNNFSNKILHIFFVFRNCLIDMFTLKISSLILGHSNIFQKGPWKSDIHTTNSFRDTVLADLPLHSECLKSAYLNILAFLKNAETRGHSECRQICNNILKKDPQNINALLQLYDISNSNEEKKKLLQSVKDVVANVSRDHYLGIALIELGVALSLLIPKYYDEAETNDVYEHEIIPCFETSSPLEFQSDVKYLDIQWRNEIEVGGICDHDLKNAYRWYNAVIYQKEGLHRLRNSHVVSKNDLAVYKFSLAQATNRLSHILLSSGGADYQRDYYADASMKLFCEIVNTLGHTEFEFYVKRSYAYLGLMVQKRRGLFGCTDRGETIPEHFKQLRDLEQIWYDPKQAYVIAKERFTRDIVVQTRYGKYLLNAKQFDDALVELEQTEGMELSEKWFPNSIKMFTYFQKYLQEREELQKQNKGVLNNTNSNLLNAVRYGEICAKGQSTVEVLYVYAKCLYWLGSEFSSPWDVRLRDQYKVDQALDVIRRVYEEYRNQDLTKVYKLHADCSKL